MKKLAPHIALFIVLGMILPTLLIGSLRWLGIYLDWTLAGHLSLGGFFYVFFVIIQSCFLTVANSLALSFAKTMQQAIANNKSI